MILFKRKFREAIHTGRKTQTVRLWKRKIAWPGQVRFSPGIGYLKVHEVTPISPADLTEADARADGFDSLADLQAELRNLYGNAVEATPDGKRLFRVTFTFLGEQKPTSSADAPADNRLG